MARLDSKLGLGCDRCSRCTGLLARRRGLIVPSAVCFPRRGFEQVVVRVKEIDRHTSSLCNAANNSSNKRELGYKLMISLQQLELAINRARVAHPASGRDARLHEDVSVLGDLYGRMIYGRLKSLALASLSPREHAAWIRWSSPGERQTQTRLYPERQASDKP